MRKDSCSHGDDNSVIMDDDGDHNQDFQNDHDDIDGIQPNEGDTPVANEGDAIVGALVAYEGDDIAPPEGAH